MYETRCRCIIHVDLPWQLRQYLQRDNTLTQVLSDRFSVATLLNLPRQKKRNFENCTCKIWGNLSTVETVYRVRICPRENVCYMKDYPINNAISMLNSTKCTLNQNLPHNRLPKIGFYCIGQFFWKFGGFFSAQSILTLKNRESIHFGISSHRLSEKESIHDTWINSWTDSLL